MNVLPTLLWTMVHLLELMFCFAWFDWIYVRDELYKDCVAALQGGLLLSGKNFNIIREALEKAFESADAKLLNW